MNGRPISAASIIILPSNTGTSTNSDGQFSIEVPAGATLTISSAGYKTQIIAAGTGENLQVRLEEDFARLDEVVVTGLATSVKRKNLANAVATISSKQLNGVAPAQTFDAALNGKIPGAYDQCQYRCTWWWYEC